MSNRIRFDLNARQAIQRGFDQIANIARATLGPTAGIVAVERVAARNTSPELISDAATAARRIVEIAGTFENIGAMMARHMAWQIRQEVGDGSATALILAQAVIDQAVKYIAAGHNVMALWHGLTKAQPYLEQRLDALAQPLEGPAHIAALATSIVQDDEIGHFVEEIFDIVGPAGFVEVRNAYGRQNDREYVEGMYWDTGWVSPYFADKGKPNQATIEQPYLLITDHEIVNPPDLIPVMNAVKSAGGKSLVIIAANIKGAALNLMVTNNARGTLRLLGIKAPKLGALRSAILEDIAIMTGGRVICQELGDTVARAKLEDLGRARQVTCHGTAFTITGTRGKPHAIRARIRALQQARERSQDETEQENLDERIGKLLGGTAILHVGGQTKSERDHKKAAAQSAVQVVRAGLQGGIVAGGGSAYIAARSALDQVPVTEEEAPALHILRHALTAPLTCLVQNAGGDPGPVLHQVQTAPDGWGFDVIGGQVVNMIETHIVDPLPTVRAALSYGLSAATMAITTDALVHRSYRDRMPSLEP